MKFLRIANDLAERLFQENDDVDISTSIIDTTAYFGRDYVSFYNNKDKVVINFNNIKEIYTYEKYISIYLKNSLYPVKGYEYLF